MVMLARLISPAAVFGLWLLEPDARFCHFRRLLNHHCYLIELNVFPVQRQKFTSAHASSESHHDRRVEVGILRGIQQGL